MSRKPFDREDDSSGIAGKRKKSWREIDAGRRTSRHVSRDEERQQERLQQSDAYEKYKKGLDALFSPGGALPQGLEQTFDPEGKRKAQRDAMAKVTEAPDRRAWAERVLEYLERYPELPDDAFFLDSLLDHPKDRVVDKALARLELLQADGRLPKAKAPRSLEQRLRTLEMTSMDDEVKARAKALRAKL